MPDSCCSSYSYGGFDNVGHCEAYEVHSRKGCGVLLLDGLSRFFPYSVDIFIIVTVAAVIYATQLLALIFSLVLGFQVNQNVNERNAQQKIFAQTVLGAHRPACASYDSQHVEDDRTK